MVVESTRKIWDARSIDRIALLKLSLSGNATISRAACYGLHLTQNIVFKFVDMNRTFVDLDYKEQIPYGWGAKSSNHLIILMCLKTV
eukprot:scaffold1525_cov142-Cylindrotheca_fusiformis.AAC.129